MPNYPSRRRLLQLTGVGAAGSIAGCSQLDMGDNGTQDGSENGNGNESENEDENDGGEDAEVDADTEPSIDPEDGLTALVQPAQEELMSLQQEVMAEVEEGELAQEEANAEFEQRQSELYTARSAEFESEVSGDDELSIDAAIPEQGMFLIEASDERLVDTLRNGEADGLIPGSEYELAMQQQP